MTLSCEIVGPIIWYEATFPIAIYTISAVSIHYFLTLNHILRYVENGCTM